MIERRMKGSKYQGQISIERTHDISMGHRVVGHEGKCNHLHGHNYRFHFVCTSDTLDSIGRIIDFGVIKERLCLWIENHWDHRMMLWDQDPLRKALQELVFEDIVLVPFNPTAEELARYIVEVVAPIALEGTGVQLIGCTVEETARCLASYRIAPTN